MILHTYSPYEVTGLLVKRNCLSRCVVTVSLKNAWLEEYYDFHWLQIYTTAVSASPRSSASDPARKLGGPSKNSLA